MSVWLVAKARVAATVWTPDARRSIVRVLCWHQNIINVFFEKKNHKKHKKKPSRDVLPIT
jgi:hypothetical protein